MLGPGSLLSSEGTEPDAFQVERVSWVRIAPACGSRRAYRSLVWMPLAAGVMGLKRYTHGVPSCHVRSTALHSCRSCHPHRNAHDSVLFSAEPSGLGDFSDKRWRRPSSGSGGVMSTEEERAAQDAADAAARAAQDAADAAARAAQDEQRS
jgi:hypothetical protein